MKWQLELSDHAVKFLRQNHLADDFISEKIKSALQKLKGEATNVDVAKLKGKWKGFYRIRIGRVRMIAEFHFENNQAYIERIDWRGGAYR